MENNEIIIKKKLIDTKEDFYYLDPLKKIPEEFWENEIWFQSPNKKNPIQLDCKKRLRDYLNERFILYQLELNNISPELYDVLPEMSLREVWYYIEILAERDGKTMDSGYNEFFKGITNYLKRIYEKMELPYWAYAYDSLKIKSKAKAMIYIYDEKELQWLTIGLDKNTLKTYTNVPFFLILCEKEDTIEPFLKELIKRDYKKEYFYCINLGGESPSNAIRLIREYLPIRNFHCFILHDMDMKGLEIFFDMKRHFINCESIGVNPEFLEYCGYEFEKLCEKYKTDTGKSRETVSSQLEDGTRTVFNELDMSIEEKERYNNWINMCIRRRIELNSITAHKIENTPLESKVKDFVDYFIYILEKSKWDLTRVRDLRKEGYSKVEIKEETKYQIKTTTKTAEWTIKPKLDNLHVVQPEFIYNVEKKGRDIFNEESKAFLDKTKELKHLFFDFYDQIGDIFDNMNEKEETIRDRKIDDFIEENEQLFDLSWDDVIDTKKNTMEHGVKMLEKYLRLKCIKEYYITKRKLVNYIGSIKYPIPIIEKKEIEMGNIVYNYKFTENKKVEKLNKILERCLKNTKEYKEAKENIFRLNEGLDKLDVKEDKRLEFLENFKERIKEAFTELIGDLNEFNNKVEY